MILRQLDILNYKNIHEASLMFSDKLNCLVGRNGQGKTNILDAIFLLSFTKSAFSLQDSQNISHDAEMALVQGTYLCEDDSEEHISCGLKRGQKKQMRRGKKDYKRLIEHIGLIPLVLVAPEDGALIEDGSDERRKFMDIVLSQQDIRYLENLNAYNALLKQRNALLKQLADTDCPDCSMLEVYELQMAPLAEYIYQTRTRFIEAFLPYFQDIYQEISGQNEFVQLRYISQLQTRNLAEAYPQTRQRDLILGWTSQGIHKDELEMMLQAAPDSEPYPLKRVGSQGQQKTYLLAMKLAQAVYLSSIQTEQSQRKQKPILLLDDIFDKLDSERVARIIHLVQDERFGQIFLTDTDRQHLSQLLPDDHSAKLFEVQAGKIAELEYSPL